MSKISKSLKIFKNLEIFKNVKISNFSNFFLKFEKGQNL